MRKCIFVLALSLLFASDLSAQNIRFADISHRARIDFEGKPPRPGLTVGDIDGDGDYDLCCLGGRLKQVQFYENRGNDKFKNVTEFVLPKPFYAVMGLLADMDNDGDPDLVYVNWGEVYSDNYFGYLENVDGRLLRVPQRTPLAVDTEHNLGGMTVGDIDVDGDLDVVLGYHYGQAYCIRNMGNGQFEDATTIVGGALGVNRRYWQTVIADFNNDGLPDIHSAIDFFPDYQSHSTGVGSLADVSTESGVTNTGSDMGLAIGDPDNDGDLDILSTNILRGVFYRNDGTGHFESVANQVGLTIIGGTGWGTCFIDFDHDGDEDLATIANGLYGRVFENNGSGHFSNVSDTALTKLSGHALLPFDHDNDGDWDLLAMDRREFPVLYENVTDMQDRHWLTVKLVGGLSNREGVGARVEVTTGRKTQMREILGAYSFFSGPPKLAHFGLGPVETVDRILIRWPSGATQIVSDVAVDQVIEIEEPF